MRLRYHTGIATFVQFIVMSLLSLINAIGSVVTTCVSKNENCLSTAFTTPIVFILLTAWFASLWLLGYQTQKRRSWRLALLLIALELGTIMVAVFEARQQNSMLGSLIHIINICFALWVIVLAIVVSRSKGGRIVASGRRRRQRHAVNSND